MAVCLVDNGAFTAAGVAYSSGELEVFAREDGRFKQWYMVPSVKLVEIVPGLPLQTTQQDLNMSFQKLFAPPLYFFFLHRSKHIDSLPKWDFSHFC